MASYDELKFDYEILIENISGLKNGKRETTVGEWKNISVYKYPTISESMFGASTPNGVNVLHRRN